MLIEAGRVSFASGNLCRLPANEGPPALVDRQKWVRNIRYLGVGGGLVAIGYFCIMLVAPFWLTAIGYSVIALGAFLLLLYYLSGLAREMWSVRKQIDTVTSEKLQRLRLLGSLLSVAIVPTFIVPIFARLFVERLGTIAHNTLIITCALFALCVLLIGFWVRYKEYRLLQPIIAR
ncbi:MAG: hypothetical protein Q8O54_01720 [Brevundimonas sp.]|nr:hypothetical protein [Brevundimonas sp.]